MKVDFTAMFDRFEALERRCSELEARLQEVECENTRLKEKSGSDLLTIAQAAEYLSVSVATIHNYCKDGSLKKHRTPSGMPRIKRQDLERLLKIV